MHKAAQRNKQTHKFTQMALFCGVKVEVTLLEAAQQSKQAQLDRFQSEKERLEADMDVPLQLKQGQVEIEPQGIVDGNLDLALLIPESLIQVQEVVQGDICYNRLMTWQDECACC